MAKQRMLLHAGKCLALALVLCIAPLCFGEIVVVKVVHGDSRGPVVNQLTTMELHYENPTPENHDRMLNRRTDADGEVRFELPASKPDSLGFQVDFNERGFKCPGRVLVDSATLMQKGLVVAHHTRKNSSSFEAHPGYDLFVASPSSRLEKILLDY